MTSFVPRGMPRRWSRTSTVFAIAVPFLEVDLAPAAALSFGAAAPAAGSTTSSIHPGGQGAGSMHSLRFPDLHFSHFRHGAVVRLASEKSAIEAITKMSPFLICRRPYHPCFAGGRTARTRIGPLG